LYFNNLLTSTTKMLQNEERINVRFALAIGFFKY